MKVFRKLLCFICAACMCAGMVACSPAERKEREGLNLDKKEMTLEIGQTEELAVLFDKTVEDKTVTWSASQDGIVKLTAVNTKLAPDRVKVRGVAAGTVTVTATAPDGKTGSATVTVKAKESQSGEEEQPAEFALTAEVVNLSVGETAAFPTAEQTGITYSSGNPSVATVDADGTVRGVAEGVTQITATKEGVTLSVKAGVLISRDDNLTLSATPDARLNYHGRSKYDETLKAQVFYFSASGYDVTFYGTQLKAVMARENSDTYVPYLSVFVDGEDMTKLVPLTSNRVIKLSTKSAKEYTLVSGLSEGWQTVKVRKRTAFMRGASKMDTVALKSLSTDGYIGYAPDKPELKIHVYGDSYSCGYGNLEDGSSMTSENTDANLAYHSLLANTVGAELTVMAASGWGMYKGNSGSADWGWATHYDKLNTVSGETVSVGGADVIIINLGANDNAAGVFPSETDNFVNAYKTMLGGLRTANPDALILCTYGFVSTSQQVKNAIDRAVSEMSDAKIVSYYYTTVKSTTGHPNVANHRNGANELKAVLENYGII